MWEYLGIVDFCIYRRCEYFLFRLEREIFLDRSQKKKKTLNVQVGVHCANRRTPHYFQFIEKISKYCADSPGFLEAIPAKRHPRSKPMV